MRKLFDWPPRFAGGDGAMLVGTPKPPKSAKAEAFREFVFEIAKERGVDTDSHVDVQAFLVSEFGIGFKSSAYRIVNAISGPETKTADKFFKKYGKRFQFRKAAALSVEKFSDEQGEDPGDDPKTQRAADLNRLAPLAKHATRDDLARLAEEAASDPADVKLVAMMLLMFRDA